MFSRPPAIQDETLLASLREGWGLDGVAADYLAVGFGSHHWRLTAADGTRRFATVDDLGCKSFLGLDPDTAFDALSRAFTTAQALQQTMNWVLGPISDVHGGVLRRLDAAHSIAVFPYVDGTAAEEYASDAERSSVVHLLVQLHRTGDPIKALARAETYLLPNRAGLEAALRDLDDDWTGGPYSRHAQALLHEHAGGVQRLLRDYDRLVRSAEGSTAGWTLTHGEPHSANVLRTGNGLRLIDWDTLLVAPPERDLWMLVSNASDGVALQYSQLTGHRVNADLLRLYALWWDLSEIGGYITHFNGPHADNRDAEESWQNLRLFIDADRRWPS